MLFKQVLFITIVRFCICRKKITVSIDFLDKTEYNINIFEYEVIEMLKRFEVENYKNFRDRIVLDLGETGGYKFNRDCIRNNTISKLMIYGRNAVGKTNLGNALQDVTEVSYFGRSEQVYTNANLPKETAKFKYVFDFDGTPVEYSYEKYDEFTFAQECLVIDNRKLYDIDYGEMNFITKDLDFLSTETLVVDRFFDMLHSNADEDPRLNRKPSFLRWMVANSALKKDSILLYIVNFIEGIRFISVGNALYPLARSVQKRFFDQFDDEFINDLENFFREMGVDIKLIFKLMPDGEKRLYFDYETPVSFFENASSGTLALFNMYRRIVLPAKSASLIFLDEYDAFYHYEIAENLFNYLKLHYPDAQVIFTTHNTNLMTNRISRPDCLFILSTKGRLTSLNNATQRELREGHNLEKLYISGEFEDYE